MTFSSHRHLPRRWGDPFQDLCESHGYGALRARARHHLGLVHLLRNVSLKFTWAILVETPLLYACRYPTTAEWLRLHMELPMLLLRIAEFQRRRGRQTAREEAQVR